ncbi:uncharacterized protein TOL2_C24340 [Desulfobacula toluolica Tol2]|uniref:Uncharacterized protein n=1 Tax=Desulfobacula toluolica (strain DSM 7467 / Tol2) TaxID=651182 RepID=K0NI41_DESTT|nr:uncharacterized protein TOL2_C24340 [Desulfobacula toluolica Tol2]
MMLSFDKKLDFAWEDASIEYFTEHELFFQLTDHSKGRDIQFGLKYCVGCAAKKPGVTGIVWFFFKF